MGLTAIVLAWMLRLAPGTPWVETYEDTAAAIAVASSGPQEAAEVTAIVFRESTGNPRAVGDHGQSLGLGQVSRWWLRGVDREAYLGDVGLQARTIVRLVRESHAMCRGRARELALSWYAAGGGGCDKRHATSRDRMRIARGLLEAM